jgi:VWFA-related protein
LWKDSAALFGPGFIPADTKTSWSSRSCRVKFLRSGYHDGRYYIRHLGESVLATRHLRFLFLLLPLLCAGSANAQDSASSTLHARLGPPSRTVYLDVEVTSKPGQPVAGLQQKDFTILDNKAPAEITSFHAFDGSQVPAEVVLLIDSVNVSAQEVAQERIGITKYLQANGGQLPYATALAVLTDKGIEIGSYTRDGNGLAKVLSEHTIGLRSIGNSGGLPGASERFQDSLGALRTLLTYESTRPGRKIVLWISPGWPLLSGPRVNLSDSDQAKLFDEITLLSTQLRETQTIIHSVNPLGTNESPASVFYYQQFLNGVKKPSEVSIANLSLQVIATQTGGLVVNSNDISWLLEQCVADTGAYYRISFEPPPTERRDVYHPLKVVVSKPGVTVSTSTGYYDQP